MLYVNLYRLRNWERIDAESTRYLAGRARVDTYVQEEMGSANLVSQSLRMRRRQCATHQGLACSICADQASLGIRRKSKCDIAGD